MKLKNLGALLLVGTLSIGLTACGGSKTDEDGEGGSKSTADKLVGKWSLDTAAVIKQAEASLTTDEEKAAFQIAKAMMSAMKMEFEFTGDGKMSVNISGMGEPEVESGTYEIKSSDGDSLVISGTIDGKTKEFSAKFVSDDSLELTPPEEERRPGMDKMLFNRVK